MSWRVRLATVVMVKKKPTGGARKTEQPVVPLPTPPEAEKSSTSEDRAGNTTRGLSLNVQKVRPHAHCYDSMFCMQLRFMRIAEHDIEQQELKLKQKLEAEKLQWCAAGWEETVRNELRGRKRYVSLAT